MDTGAHGRQDVEQSSTSARLDIQDEISGGRHTLHVTGELDIASAPQLEAVLVRLCETGANWLTLDLSKVSFMDSSGVKAVLSAAALCQKHQYEFLVTPGPPEVHRIFELTGLVEQLPFQRDTDD